MSLNTNMKRIARLDHAKNGNIKFDYGGPTVCNIGYNDMKNKKYDRRLYSIWCHMLNRCYNVNNSEYNLYGGCGVSVCQEWLYLSNFINDVTQLLNYDKYIKNPDNYQLDKDYLQFNIPKCNRIYSKNTCIWINKIDNFNLCILENSIKPYSFGLIETEDGLFKVYMYINNNPTYFGTYDDRNAALNAYNIYYLMYKKYEMVPVINDCIAMGFDEVMSHRLDLKNMIKII